MARDKISRLLDRVFIGCWMLLLLGLAAVRWRWLGVAPGLSLVSLTSAILLLYGLLSLPGVFVRMVSRKPVMSATLVRCILGILPLSFFFFSVGSEGLRAPAIHDITTDFDSPPQFVLAGEARGVGDHGVDYEGDVIASLQRQSYPHISPLEVNRQPAQAIALAKDIAVEKGWQVLGVRESPGGGVTLEAVVTSLLFQFKDDIVIRALPIEGGSRLDIRSASRVGLGDLGANARRVSEFAQRLEEKI
jgi:uncharacterized protein (DUF1499 family)